MGIGEIRRIVEINSGESCSFGKSRLADSRHSAKELAQIPRDIFSRYHQIAMHL